MTAYTETVHLRITVLETRALEVRTTTRVWAVDGEQRQEIGVRESTVELLRGADISSQAPEVIAVAAAAWTPADVQERTDALLGAMREQHAKLVAKAEEELQALNELRAAAEQAKADHERARAAAEAARQELAAEHQVLAERAARVTADRQVIAQQRDTIRRQRPKLASLIEQMEAEERAADRGRHG